MRLMMPRESAILMGFPAAWRLPLSNRAAQKAVGNAMCVLLSKAIVLAAMAMRTGQAATLPVPSAHEFRLLKRRIEALEAKVDALTAVPIDSDSSSEA